MPMNLIAKDLAILKRDLRMAVTAITDNFKQKHGICPSDIHVCFVESTTHGDTIKQYTVSTVDVEFSI